MRTEPGAPAFPVDGSPNLSGLSKREYFAIRMAVGLLSAGDKGTKKGGIIIPDTAKEKPQEGNVVALGTGKVNEDGKKVEFTVKKGDKVLISKYGGTVIKVDGESYLIMREDDILGIIG